MFDKIITWTFVGIGIYAVVAAAQIITQINTLDWTKVF